MREGKSHYTTIYSALSKDSSFSKHTNVLDLIQQSKKEEKKEKKIKFLSLIGFASIILLFSFYAYL
tara:strand:+ start:261 stop:458 length:198 start_codon:yes stop_codon:yes gene_type:complete